MVIFIAESSGFFAFQQSAAPPRKETKLHEFVKQSNDNVVIDSQHLSRRAVMNAALPFTMTAIFTGKALAATSESVMNKSTQKAIEKIGDGKPFALNAKLSVIPELREVWMKEIQAFQKSTRNDEERSLEFSVSEDVGKPNTFYLHQQYADKAAFRAHLESPHSKRYEAFLVSDKPFSKGGDPITYFFSPLEEGSDWAIKNKRSKPSKTGYCVTVNLYPKKAKRGEFLEVIKANKQGTDTTEKLALQYTFGESALKPGVFHFHEEYKGKEEGKQGFDAHANSPHFAGWVKFTETDPFEKPPEVYFSKILEG